MRITRAFVATLVLSAAACGRNAPTSQPSRPGASRLVRAVDPVAGSWIVTLRPDAAPRGPSVAALARELAGRHGGTLGHVYERSVRGFEVKLDADAAAALADDPRVARVEEDAVVRAAASSVQWPAPWNLDVLDAWRADGRYVFYATGTGVTLYVIDTGVRATHQEFRRDDGSSRVGAGFAAIAGGGTGDCNGHGTHVASTAAGAVYGVAKAAAIEPVRVLGCDATGALSDVLAGIEWMTANHATPAVALLSLTTAGSATLDEAVAASVASGVVYAVAAGDGGGDACALSPARSSSALTVSATAQRDDAAASGARQGACVDLFAPGDRITAAWSVNDGATALASGTSMAAAHVAGAAAQVLERRPAATPAQVADLLVATSLRAPAVVAPGTPDRLLSLWFTPWEPPADEDAAPAAAITSLADGDAVGGVVDVAVDATDDLGVTRVELFVDGAFAGSTRTSPFSVAWDSALLPDGAHALEAVAYDRAGHATRSAAVTVTATNPGIARFDATLGVPACATIAPACDPRALLDGRAGLGPEANAPNTLRDAATGVACADGGLGTYHGDESIDFVRVATEDGTDLAVGKIARIDVGVWALAPGQDALDLFFTADANAPSWQHLVTLDVPGAGPQVLSARVSVPDGALPAIRASFRYGGDVAACTTGDYDDHDDLAFAAGPGTPDAAAPSVAITAPLEGATVSGTIPWDVDATDADGIVTRVELYVDGALFASRLDAPWGVSWHAGALPDGEHVLTARAFDGAGHAALSAPVRVEVRDTTPPTVAITAPAADTVWTGILDVRADASDDGVLDHVELYANDVLVGTDAAPPALWQWNTWTVHDGEYTLVARAYDAMGNMGESAPVAITVDDPSAPMISISSPIADEKVSGVVRFAADATDDGIVDAVRFLLEDAAGNQTLLGTGGTAPYEVEWNSGTVPNGAYALVVQASDVGGNVRTEKVAFAVDDHVAPSVELVAPIAGAVLSGDATLRARAADAGVVGAIEFLVDDAVVASASAASGEASWDTRAANDGDHTLSARARDGAGNVATTPPVTVTLRNPGAAYDAALGAPVCATERAYCHTGSLVDGRGVVGPEQNAPNTLGAACADGNQGAYHEDDGAIDWIAIASTDGGPLTSARPARVTVRAWIGSVTEDRIDVFVAADAKAPAWKWVATLQPSARGAQTLSADVDLPWGDLQAVRAALRYGGSAAPCTSGLFDDRDDLAFAAATPKDETAPVPTITSPADGATVKGVVSVEVAVADDGLVSFVEVRAGGVLVGTADVAPYAVAWDTSGLAPGTYDLVATAYDGAGNAGESGPILVTVGDLVPPSVAITSPAEGEELAPGAATLAATVADDGGVARVEFRVDGGLIGADVEAPYAVSWNPGTVANGPHTLTVTARDLAGNASVASRAFTTNDATLPAVQITYPAAGASVVGSIRVDADASDAGGVQRVVFYADGKAFAEDATAPYSVVWSASGAAAGAHLLVAKALDAAGNEGTSAAVQVNVADTQAPVAALTAPLAGETVRGAVTLRATASDDVGVARVDFLADGVVVASATASPWTATWSTTSANDGERTLVARAVDGAQNAGDSAPVEVVVANAGQAAYDKQLKAPKCGTAGARCASGDLLVGRGLLGPEPKAPNTIASTCADGQNGTFHVDESVDAITVTTLDGSPLAAGKTVRVDVKVWAGARWDLDALDVWSAADARSPSWTARGTLHPTQAGAQVLSTTFVLPAGATQAVRATLRYGGSAAPCTTGSFDDHDDLAFTVSP